MASQRMDAAPFSLGCEHYRRKCKLVSPCCKNNYICRFCHDESESHSLDRPNITEVECLVCKEKQPFSQTCSNCGIIFGNYFCEICKLFGDEDMGMYHCEGCGLCRVGGRDKFFHCDICELCLPTNIRNTHKCIVQMGKANCPVCLEDIHTSRNVSHIPPCSHLIHRPCFDDLISAGFYACPVCGSSMIHMEEVWKSLDEEIRDTPMPGEYSDVYCNVLCRDCNTECSTLFHVLGNKCMRCGSYNTVRAKGGLYHQQQEQLSEGTEESEYQHSGSSGAAGFTNDTDSEVVNLNKRGEEIRWNKRREERRGEERRS